MKTIPNKFRVNGLTHELIKRNKKWAVYKATCPKEGWFSHYELHQIRIRPKRTLFGKEIEESEKLASNNEFGKFALCGVKEYNLPDECYKLSQIKDDIIAN